MKYFLYLIFAMGIIPCAPKSNPPTSKLPDMSNASDAINKELIGTRWSLMELYGKE